MLQENLAGESTPTKVSEHICPPVVGSGKFRFKWPQIPEVCARVYVFYIKLHNVSYRIEVTNQVLSVPKPVEPR